MADPRLALLDVPPISANEALRDRAIRHAVYLERLKGGEAKRILRFLDEQVYPDLLGKLTARMERIRSRGFDRGPWTTKRYKEMLASLDEVVRRGMLAAKGLHQESLFAIGKAEAQWQSGLLRTSSPVVFETLLPSTATLRAIVTTRPFQGKLLREWWGRQDVATRGLVRQAVNIGIAEGEGTDAIVRRMRALLPQSRRGAEGIVRTAVNHVTTAARDATFKVNSDLVKAVQWLSTLDARTTPICQDRDGKVYQLDDGPRPPAHVGCRSTTVPILKSWKDLGFDLDDVPPGTRASMNGQVPADTTYGEWLKGQPAGIQNEALGRTRADLFRKGGLDVSRFVDRRGATITLDRLRELEADAFEAAGA